MPNSPQKRLQQPKTRSSCDGCGTVKLKCDRKHPVCGRCATQGIPCVYGVSRKTGKPARSRININGAASTDLVDTNCEPFPRGPYDSLMNYTWDVTKDKESNTSHDENDQESGDSSIDHSNGNITAFNLDAFFNDTYGNLSGSPISTLNSLDFGEWPVGDHLNANSIINNLQFASMESDWAGELASGRITDGIEQGLPEATRDHDCHGEAYKLLGRSLFADLLPDISPCQPATAMLAIDESSSNRLALDQLLLLNRKSSERLGTLLTCSCASKPYLMMLYASCISAILTRYQHAARGALRTSCDSLVLHDAVGTNGKEGSTALRNQSIGPAVAPARVAIGAFSVNNQRVQSALNIQLLAGEVREVVHLIDRFASCQFETPQTGEQSSGSRVNGLHQSLSFWLRGEHSKITDEIRNRLTELNA